MVLGKSCGLCRESNHVNMRHADYVTDTEKLRWVLVFGGKNARGKIWVCQKTGNQHLKTKSFKDYTEANATPFSEPYLAPL